MNHLEKDPARLSLSSNNLEQIDFAAGNVGPMYLRCKVLARPSESVTIGVCNGVRFPKKNCQRLIGGI